MSRKPLIALAIVLSAVLFGIIGLLLYDRYFVPTTLVVCVDPAEKVEAVIIQDVHGGGELFVREPENGVARFEKISKGQWKVYFVKRNDEGPFYVEMGEGMFDGVEARLYMSRVDDLSLT